MNEKNIKLDLNKLSWDEIDSLSRIIRKSQSEAEIESDLMELKDKDVPKFQAIEKEIEQLMDKATQANQNWTTNVSEFKKRKDLFLAINQELAKGNNKFRQIYLKLSGKKSAGSAYPDYRKWCEENNLKTYLPYAYTKKNVSNETNSHIKHYKSKEYYTNMRNKYMPVYELLSKSDGKMKYLTAFQKVYHQTPCGGDYIKYRQFCKSNRLKTYLPRKRKSHSSNHPVRRQKPIELIPTPAEIVQQPEPVITAITEKKEIKYNAFLDFKQAHIVEFRAKNNVPMPMAMKLLGQIWINSGRQRKTADALVANSYVDKFPKILDANGGMTKILIDVVRNVIQKPSLEMSFAVEGFLFGITDFRAWEDFCIKFGVQSKEIAEYFSVHNKFIIAGRGKEKVIRYG